MSKTTKGQNFWDQYADIYDILLILKAYRTLMADMLKAANIVPGMSVADFGCGTGNFLMILFHKLGNAIKGYGFDYSRAMLKHAQSKLVHSEYFISQLDLSREVDLGLRFDRILCSQVLYALPDPATAIRTLKTHLNPEGRIVLINPDSGQFMGLILMDQCAKQPTDPTRWQTNDQDELTALGEEVFGDISVAEIAASLEESWAAAGLKKFGETKAKLILKELLRINIEIVARAQQEGSYYFTSHEKLTSYVSQSGLQLLSHGRSYGNQCHIVVAQPAR
jgi:ubiquinone/menaquinone biosynthesis C-methylase UbiE